MARSPLCWIRRDGSGCLVALQCGEQAPRWADEWVKLDEWYHGRVVLIEDAAYADPTQIGQGGCMAVHSHDDRAVQAQCFGSCLAAARYC
jgi:hypothetical protein